jgi:hypothetical protein
MSISKTGVALGAVFGVWHLCWSLLVATKWAQPVIDFVFWIHFIKPIYVIEPFDTIRAIILILVTSTIGLVFGSLFALIWNWFHKN